MKKRALLITLMAAIMLPATAVVSVAGAVPPGFCDDGKVHPQCPPAQSSTSTTATDAPPALWTCQARNENGAGWDLGQWDGTAYLAGLASCTDILVEHLTVTDWAVVWTGTTQRGTVKGLKFVFEEQVHDNPFAEAVFAASSGVWCPTLPVETAIENMVFVAMPRNGDKWTSFEVTVTPGHQEVCPG